jgi:hypothetical protein
MFLERCFAHCAPLGDCSVGAVAHQRWDSEMEGSRGLGASREVRGASSGEAVEAAGLSALAVVANLALVG